MIRHKNGKSKKSPLPPLCQRGGSKEDELKAALVLEDEQPYPIPEKWVWSKLGSLVNIKYGKGLKKEIRKSGDYPVYGSNGIVGFHDKSLSKGQTIIIGRKGSVGEVHHSNTKCWPIDTTYYIDDLHAIDYPFLSYLLGNIGLGQLDKSTAIPGINRNELYAVNIPFPPLPEQQHIAEKLESLLGKIKEAKTLLDEVPEILQNFRQNVLAAACSGRLTEDWRKENLNVESAAELVHKIYSNKLNDKTLPKEFSLQDDEGALPRSWIMIRFGSLSQLITKGASPKWQGFNYVDDGTLFITSENVGNGRLLLENRKYVENDFNRVQKRSILQKGDLLTNIVGASIGRSAIFDLDENANINQAVAVIRTYPEIINKYILIALNSPSTIDFMHKEKVDVARANLSLQDVSNFPINLPPTAEQQEIVRRVESLFSKADDLETQYKEAMELVESLPEIILSKAFRGKLVPQDPNDEPAIKLLERIIKEQTIPKAAEVLIK